MQDLNIRYPLVMAPMFLVSNIALVKAGMQEGILACFPSLNFRKPEELDAALKELNGYLDERKGHPGTYGMNLIVQRSNPWFSRHLEVCVSNKVPVVITSLGNPTETINAVHAYGGKVFCDVTTLEHARKCVKADCDGFIAVGQGAGGHAGPFPLMLLIEMLKKHFPKVPILGAGGIANGKSLLSAIAAGASAGYCGTRFIASAEADVSDAYKQAIVSSKMKDIVMTERLSGTPCAVINTEFARKIGTKQNAFERFMSSNPKTKKIFKMLVQRRGFKWLEDAVKPGNYNSLWCAGQSVEMINDILPVKDIIQNMMQEFHEEFAAMNKDFHSENTASKGAQHA